MFGHRIVGFYRRGRKIVQLSLLVFRLIGKLRMREDQPSNWHSPGEERKRIQGTFHSLPHKEWKGIVNLFISADEFSPLRGFFSGLFIVILHEKRSKKHSSSPLFRKNTLIIA